MSQPKTESKREEFRKYLEGAGVLDALTKGLVGLYEEPDKPKDPLDFLKQHLHAGMPESINIEALKKEVEELKQKNLDLEGQVSQLQAELLKQKNLDLEGQVSQLQAKLSKCTDTEANTN